MDPKILTSLGLNEKSAKIYLAGLELGTTSVQELARKSGLKRPTVYLHLDELVVRGFFETISINNKQYFRAADPEQLQSTLKKNVATFEREVPRLMALRADTLGKPQVRVYEGDEGVRRVYEEMKEANSIRFWSNVGTLNSFHDTYMEIADAIRENSISTREITADTKPSRRYIRLFAKASGPSYAAKVASVEGLENDSIIYGNVVALFRLVGMNTFVVRIEDKTIADSMRALFDMAWKSAKPLK